MEANRTRRVGEGRMGCVDEAGLQASEVTLQGMTRSDYRTL